MTATIQKWGNSHAVRLPKAVVEQAGLASGVAVRVRAVGNVITIRPARRVRRIPLKELLHGMTPARNRYREFDARPVGKELI